MRINLIFSFLVHTLSGQAQTDISIEMKDLSLDSMGDLKWKITGLDEVSQQVEHFRDGNWVVIADRSWSSFAVADSDQTIPKPFVKDSLRVRFHKGLNRYRIRVSSPSAIVSPEVHLHSRTANDTLSVWVVHNEIVLNGQEYFEILDHNGTIMIRGEAGKVDISSLPDGSYFLYTKKSTKAFTK